MIRSPKTARRYLGERGLLDETIQPLRRRLRPRVRQTGCWARPGQGVDLDLLEKVGLIARRIEGTGHYDRFRDRIMFPIRDALGQTVGFGGRILPTSPLLPRASEIL